MRHRFCSSLIVGLILVILFGTLGCARQSTPDGPADFTDRKMRVVVTTNIVGDLVRQLGGDHVDLTTLMGPGVDPHLYKASEGDVQTMSQADLVLYNGLHLEGKMTEVFEQMERRSVSTSALAEEALPDSVLISSAEYASSYDPHVWFDVSLWAEVARHTAQVLATRDTAHADAYRANAEAYVQRLDSLDQYVASQAQRIPEQQRVLITSHDAFRYFGRAYDVEVRGLQGISTATEAGTRDVQSLAEFVVDRQIPSLFAESSVSPRGIEAVREAVQSRGFEVTLGGTLYGDALGNRGTPTGTYVGATRHNIDTIVDGLLRNSNPSPTAAGQHRP